MRANFSQCGKYLHIASIEAELAKGQGGELPRSPVSWERASEGEERKEILVTSAFITTHQLSERKTTRSPPRLIHKVKVSLGKSEGISLERLPITFSWTADYLYLSFTDYKLNVIRTGLFKPTTGVPLVTVPKLPIMLPLSSIGRQIYYIPSRLDDPRAIVLIGSYEGSNGLKAQWRQHAANQEKGRIGEYAMVHKREPMPYPCPPVGIYLDEELDLGGWLPSKAEKAIESGRKFRDGRLVRPIEYFNFQEDYDLEGICAVCKGSLFFSFKIR
jgi:hypothetical protein